MYPFPKKKRCKGPDLSYRQISLQAALLPSLPMRAVPTQEKRIPVVDSMGAETANTGQALQITTSPTLIVPARTRSGIELTNLSTVDIYFGFDSTVTPTTGHLLLGTRGTCKYIPTQAPVWAIASAGLGQLSWLEIWDE